LGEVNKLKHDALEKEKEDKTSADFAYLHLQGPQLLKTDTVTNGS